MSGSGDYLEEIDEVVNYNPDDYLLEDYFDHFEVHEELPRDVWDNCVILSINAIIPTIARLIILNFVFSVVYKLGFLSVNVAHICTGCIGIYLIICLDTSLGKFLTFSCFVISYFLLRISYLLRKYVTSQRFVTIPFIALLIIEYHLIDGETWIQIRGVIMIIVMKLISLASDVDDTRTMPTFTEYFGYIFCGANVLFGPWIPFSDYMAFYRRPSRKGLAWFFALAYTLCAAIVFLSISNCWTSYFVTEDYNRFIVAYREAMSFRTSHYFVSFLSETGMIACGYYNQFGARRGVISQYRYIVTEPFEIEWPSSLSSVVRKWNHPMHEFLKKYVYRSYLQYGQFCAIFLTFLMSSFLHGLETKVSMVLLSLGIFSYLQVAARNRMALIFNICVTVRPCRDCHHKYKRNSIIVKIFNMIYTLATVFHLAYLGVLMDQSTNSVGILGKWQHLYFIGHVMMIGNIVMIL